MADVKYLGRPLYRLHVGCRFSIDLGHRFGFRSLLQKDWLAQYAGALGRCHLAFVDMQAKVVADAATDRTGHVMDHFCHGYLAGAAGEVSVACS